MNTPTHFHDPGRSLPGAAEHPPKLLPWLASQAGLAEGPALALWRQARQETQTGSAMPRFLALLEAERKPKATSPAAWLELYDQAWRGNSLRLADLLLAGMHRSWMVWQRDTTLAS